MSGRNWCVLVLATAAFLPATVFANPVMINWVAYSPSDSWRPGQVADSSLIWHDLNVLAGFGFTGIVTYGTLDSLCIVPRFARRLGFENVVMGVWIDSNETLNRRSVELAIEYASDADAICVGNEALFNHLTDTTILKWAMDTIRAATGKPVTTGEHWSSYSVPAVGPWLLRNSDFLFPILNPTDNGIHDPDTAVQWVLDRLADIRVLAGDSLDVVIKEAGWPTNSNDTAQRVWANEVNQYRFLGELRGRFRRTDSLYFCFEAFDGWWKDWEPTQQHWGLFHGERLPKLYAYSLGLAAPARPAARATAMLLARPEGELYDLSGQRVRAGRLRAGIYFTRAGPNRFSKALVVR